MAQPEELGYILSEAPVYKDGQLERYATDDPTIFVERFEAPIVEPGEPEPDFSRYLDIYEGMRSRLLEQSLEAYIPEVVDSDIEDHWVAFGIPSGLYSLREVRNSFPDGLDGRDWAWILRRILMVLETANRRPDLTEENILVHPDGHGIVLLGWHPIEDPDVYPLDQLKELMDRMLLKSVDSKQQISFVTKAAKSYRSNRKGQYQIKLDSGGTLFGYDAALREYELKLRNLYGPPKFRAMELDENFSIPYLSEESERLQKAGS